MATALIPVDLCNPGQVLASLGFLETLDAVLGDAEGGFEWSEGRVRFVLSSCSGQENPFEIVLRFLAEARVVELMPEGYAEGGPTLGGSDPEQSCSSRSSGGSDADADEAVSMRGRAVCSEIPASKWSHNSLPLRLENAEGHTIVVSHWTDGSSRKEFKLYAGNRSAVGTATQMLQGSQVTRGLTQLWEQRRDALIRSPFDVLTPMSGTFNFDARGTWIGIDAGYSPDRQKDWVAASPVVEILAAIGLEHARPDEYESKKVRYFAWGEQLTPMLARAVFAGANVMIPRRCFEFEIRRSGQNKIVTFAREETD